MANDPSPKRLVSARRLLPLGLLVAAWIVFMLAGGYRYLTFSALAQNRDRLHGLVQQCGILAAFVRSAGFGKTSAAGQSRSTAASRSGSR